MKYRGISPVFTPFLPIMQETENTQCQPNQACKTFPKTTNENAYDAQRRFNGSQQNLESDSYNGHACAPDITIANFPHMMKHTHVELAGVCFHR